MSFIGVGVGPGDPELMTLKACRVIREADIILLPSAPKEKCRAYQIIKGALGDEIDDNKVMECDFPMTMDASSRDAYHNNVAELVCSLDKEGKTIVFPTIGDPTLYSTYTYLAERLIQKGIKCSIISGISSPFAAAAAINTDLALDREEVHIIPGQSDPAEAMRLKGTKIFMKNRSGLPKLLEAIKERKGEIEVYGVTDLGMTDEKKYYGIDEMSGDMGYLTTIIVKEGDENTHV